LDVKAVRLALSDRTIGHNIVYHRSMASTMDECRRLADESWSEGLVVTAEEQTSARGRFNRFWVNRPGESLSLSVLLRPSVEQLHYVNMAATLAVFNTIKPLVNRKTSIKWPNDVRVGGLKISGILIETDSGISPVQYAVVGIGMNIGRPISESPEIIGKATSIDAETEKYFERTQIMIDLLRNFDDLYTEVIHGNSLTEEWSSHLDTIGRRIEVRWGDRLIKGFAREVDEQGNLILYQQDGSTVTVVGGEVTLQV